MKRLGIIFILICFVLMNIPFVSEVSAPDYYDENPPSSSSGGFINPSYAYRQNDTYATANVVGNSAEQIYSQFRFTSLPTITAKVYVGIEHYMNTTEVNVSVSVSTDGGVSYTSSQTPDDKTSDDNTTQYLDFTSNRTWTWALLTDARFFVKVNVSTGDKAGAYFLDYLCAMVKYSGGLYIEMLNPRETEQVHDRIDFISKVEIPTGYVVDEVTYQINSIYYVSEYESSTGTYRYMDFQTKHLGDGYFTITAKVNYTNSVTGEDYTRILINNNNQGCVWDDELQYWDCHDTRLFIPDPTETIKGWAELTKGVETTYWCMDYFYFEESTGTSNAFYRPYENGTYTDFNIWIDEFHLDGYDYSERSYINDTASTAATGDDTELNNDTYVSYWRGDGGQNVTVESSVSMDVSRHAEIQICAEFAWSRNPDTLEWSYGWSFTNNLEATMTKLILWIPFKDPADLDTVVVTDTSSSTVLDPAKDYLLMASGVSIGFSSLTSGSSQSLSISYIEYKGDKDNTLTMTITDADLTSGKVVFSGHDYTHASKNITNSNIYDITDGRLIVIWQIDAKIKISTLRITDEDGSTYTFYPDGERTVVQHISIDSGELKYYHFYFDVEADTSLEWAWNLLPIAGMILLILGVGCGIALTRGVKDPDTRKYVVFGGLMGIFFGCVFIFIYYVLPLMG